MLVEQRPADHAPRESVAMRSPWRRIGTNHFRGDINGKAAGNSSRGGSSNLGEVIGSTSGNHGLASALGQIEWSLNLAKELQPSGIPQHIVDAITANDWLRKPCANLLARAAAGLVATPSARPSKSVWELALCWDRCSFAWITSEPTEIASCCWRQWPRLLKSRISITVVPWMAGSERATHSLENV